MTTSGRYADGRGYELPTDWAPLNDDLLSAALDRARQASAGDAMDRLRRFYDRESEYAGTSFLDAAPNPPDAVHAADLYAVSRLSITVINLQGRLLLHDTQQVTRTKELLAAIPPELTIADLTSSTLTAMWDLQHHFRSLLATDTKQSNHWVFAAKLCARKRPALFPVRDSVVCRYLSGGQQLAGSAAHARQGRLGWFSSDVQVFAYIATDAALQSALRKLQAEADRLGISVDNQPLRLLDALLWTRGKSNA
jgi:hypothetical protein